MAFCFHSFFCCSLAPTFSPQACQMKRTLLPILFLFGILLYKNSRAEIYHHTRVVTIIRTNEEYKESVEVLGRTINEDGDIFLSYDKQLEQITDIKVM